MRLSATLLYISCAISLVYAEPSQPAIFFYTPTQDYYSANLTFPGIDRNGSHYWGPITQCLLPGGPNTNPTIGDKGACNNLPKYYYFDFQTFEAGKTTRIAITLPDYILDASCVTILEEIADMQCNVTAGGSKARPGPEELRWNLAEWYLDYGLRFREGQDPGLKIVCTNTSTIQ